MDKNLNQSIGELLTTSHLLKLSASLHKARQDFINSTQKGCSTQEQLKLYEQRKEQLVQELALCDEVILKLKYKQDGV